MTTTEPVSTEDDQVATVAPEIDAPATDQTPEVVDTDSEQEPSREAAKYRLRLRESEAERDGLRTRLEHLQRGEVERLVAAANVAQPSAIWATVKDLGELLDSDGNVDQVAVDAATKAAIKTLGLAVRHQLKPDPSQGARGGGGDPAGSWANLLRTNKR